MQVQSLGQKGSPGGGNDNPLLYSGLENFMDRGAWHTLVYRVEKSWTQWRMRDKEIKLYYMSKDVRNQK